MGAGFALKSSHSMARANNEALDDLLCTQAAGRWRARLDGWFKSSIERATNKTHHPRASITGPTAASWLSKKRHNDIKQSQISFLKSIFTAHSVQSYYKNRNIHAEKG